MFTGFILVGNQATAAPTTYEDFFYNPGLSLDASGGGTGWDGVSWGQYLGGTRGFTTVAGVLEDPSGGLLVNTSSGHVYGDGTITVPSANAYAGRFNSFPPGQRNAGNGGTVPGTQIYMSVLMRPDTLPEGSSFGLQIYSSNAEDAFLGKTGGSSFWHIESGAIASADSTKTITLGQTALVVVRINCISTAVTTFNIYINPTPGGPEPATPDATITYNFGQNQNGVALQANLGAQVSFDELRIGSTFGDVTPSNGVVITHPTMSVSLSGSDVIVSWPTSNAASFNLYSRPDATAGGWTLVSPSPTIVGANYQVTVPHTGNAQFFRLSNP